MVGPRSPKHYRDDWDCSQSQVHFALSFGLMDKNVHNFSTLFSKSAFKNALHSLFIMKIPSTRSDKSFYPKCTWVIVLIATKGGLLAWQPTVVMDCHIRKAFLPYLWLRRKSNWQSSSGEWREGGSEKGNKKGEGSWTGLGRKAVKCHINWYRLVCLPNGVTHLSA